MRAKHLGLVGRKPVFTHEEEDTFVGNLVAFLIIVISAIWQRLILIHMSTISHVSRTTCLGLHFSSAMPMFSLSAFDEGQVTT